MNLSRTRILCAVICVMVWMSLFGCTGTWTRRGDKGLRASVEGSYLYGPISGYLQTPSGGTPGTTSDKRPTFEELDMENVGIIDGSVAGGKGAHDLYVGARIVRLHSETTLDNTLISQNKTYPAGSSVEADVKLDWYRAGYRHRFNYRYDKKAYIGFYPALELGLFDFHYQLDGPNNLSTDRK